MGDGQILLKTRRDDSFKEIYQMSLISAGSISLDSTFKSVNLFHCLTMKGNHIKLKTHLYLDCFHLHA